MPKIYRLLLGLGLALASLTTSPAADDVTTFQLRGQNPDGKSGYTGTVDVRKQGDTLAIRWLTGQDHAETIGFGISASGVIGAGYGGEALYSVGIYEQQGKTLHATWAMASRPGTVGTYDLTGSPNFSGVYKFADGTSGSMTVTPTRGGSYKMAWDLPSGHFDGIAVKSGNALIAVSGAPGGQLGVAGYRPNGDNLEGVWTTAGLNGVGKEFWTVGAGSTGNSTPQASAPSPQPAAPASESGPSVTLAGETYFLKDNKSAPGNATSELREYLRPGEDWDGYRKMVAFREMGKNVKADAATMAKGTLAETKKSYPGAFMREVLLKPDHAIILFIITAGDLAEFNIFDYRKTKTSLTSAQFVLRNKPPYETQDKFKAEQDAHYNDWVNELQALSLRAKELIDATREGASAAPAPAPVTASAKAGKDDLSPELVEAITADLKKCSAIGQEFITLLRAGETKKAVAMLSDSAFKKVSREQFTAGLLKSSQSLGALQDFTPDKQATDFGVRNGVMTFTLKGDAKYARASTKETLYFIRNGKGEIEFIDYLRDPK